MQICANSDAVRIRLNIVEMKHGINGKTATWASSPMQTNFTFSKPFRTGFDTHPWNRPIARQGRQTLFDSTITVERFIIHRDIHLVHHSHTDIGYSHLQAEVETIQNNNIWKALELIDRTKDYLEGQPLRVERGEPLGRGEFPGHRQRGGQAALHRGGEERQHRPQRELRQLDDRPVHARGDALDRGVRRLAAEVVRSADHHGDADRHPRHELEHGGRLRRARHPPPEPGAELHPRHARRRRPHRQHLREQGDKPYWWKGTTGKDSILVWTAGQGYGGWHGYTAGAIKERGTRKIAAYMNELAAKGYPYDMVQWRYNIVSDNGPVDSTLSDFVREWNEKYAHRA